MAKQAGRRDGVDGSGMCIAVVAARFNEHVTQRLLEGALHALREYGVETSDVEVHWVPGAFELPLVARRLASSGRNDAVICLGAVIRGETAHFDHVASVCSAGVARAAYDTGMPVIFGVLTTDDEDQALARAGGALGNKGDEAARSAVEMVALLRELEAGRR